MLSLWCSKKAFIRNLQCGEIREEYFYGRLNFFNRKAAGCPQFPGLSGLAESA
jgi:hypothetical protein